MHELGVDAVCEGLAGCEDAGVDNTGIDDEEEAFGAGQDGAVGVDELGGVVELAAVAAEMAGDEAERGVDGRGAEVVDLHVAGHGEEIEGAVELGHGFVHEDGDDAAMEVAGRALVQAGEVDGGGGGDVFGVDGVDYKGEMKALGVVGAAAEAEVGALVDSARGEGFGDVRFGGHQG